MKFRKFLLYFLATICLIIPDVYSQVNYNTFDKLTGIAKKFLVAKNQLLVNGYADTNMENHLLTADYLKEARSQSKKILIRRRLLVDAGQDYSDFQTKLTVKETNINKSLAFLTISEYTVLRLYKSDIDPLAPRTTEYVQDHLFTFVSDMNKNWKLYSDKLINMPTPVIPKVGERPINIDIETTLADNYYTPDDHSNTKLEYIENEIQNNILTKKYTINKTVIVNYAYKYWKKYNTNYKKFSKDCTNFVSQAVDNGGWPFVYGWYRSSNVWFYWGWKQSWTWAGAHNWYRFIKKKRRGYIAKYFNQMQKGDILQVDFNRDGHIDHSMIVTKKDSSKTIYLTYHTNNTKDRSIKDILSKYPRAKYYGWRLYASFK